MFLDIVTIQSQNFYLITGSLYFLTIFTHSPSPLLETVNLLSVSKSSFLSPVTVFCFPRFHIKVKSYSICLSLSDSFHLAQWHQGPAMSSQMTEFPSLCGLIYLYYICLYDMCIYVSIVLTYILVYMYIHIYCPLIYSSISRHLDWFHILVFVSNVAINMGMLISYFNFLINWF